MPDVKIFTNQIKERYSINGRRQINIDPGYVAMPHLIIATGKGYSHRPDLLDDIFADLTLIYQKKSFRPLPWTYPDYAEEQVIEIFNKIRSKYVEQLRH